MYKWECTQEYNKIIKIDAIDKKKIVINDASVTSIKAIDCTN